MTAWLLTHWGNILVLGILCLCAALAVRSLRRDRKKGGCCGGCKGCSMACSCEKTNGSPKDRT